jgi:hypothetical protein
MRKCRDDLIIQELQWKSFSDANGKRKDVTEKLFSGEYILVTVAMPRCMVEGTKEDKYGAK